MPNSGNRKQRYVLDIDDVVRDGFMTKENAETLIRGINASGGTVKLGVPFGGTNNASFVDQELLKYDAITGKIVSSGQTGTLPGGQSVFIPWETRVQYKDFTLDSLISSTSEVQLGEFSFTLGANAAWSDLMVTFQFGLDTAHSSMGGLRLLLNDDVIEPSEILCPNKTILYQVGATSDSFMHTWIAMGTIPDAHVFDDPLVVHLMGVPQDAPNMRSCIVRLSSRNLDPPPAGGQKGIPVFLNPPFVFHNAGATAWTTVNITSHVPLGASAVIIHALTRSHQQGSGPWYSYYRAEDGATEYLLTTVDTDHGDDYTDTDTCQLVLPYKSLAGVRSFDFIAGNANQGTTLTLIGYIT